MARLPSDLPKRLRDAGLTVVEIDGWETRERPASTGGFEPVGVLWHHTGAASRSWSIAKEISYARWLFLTGRSDLPAPLCQISIGASGTVYVGAAGRANHAGKAKSSGTVAAGDGNRLYIGVECMNSGSEGWPDKQYAAMVTTGVVLGGITGNSVETQRAHRETSVTGKWDPGMLDMDKFRADIAKASRVSSLPTIPVRPVEPTTKPRRTRGKAVDGALRKLRGAKGSGNRKQAIEAAQKALRSIPFFGGKK